MEKKQCTYCGKKTSGETNVCQACKEKLPFARRLIAIGVEIKLRAAQEKGEPKS